MIQFLKSDVAAFRLYMILAPWLVVFPLLIMFFFSPSSPSRTDYAYYIVFCFLIVSLLLGSVLREAAGEKGMPIFPKFLLESSLSSTKLVLLDFLCQAIVVFCVTSPVLLVCVLLFGFEDVFWSVLGGTITARSVGTASLWVLGRMNIYLSFGSAAVCMGAVLIMMKVMRFESSIIELQVYLLISVVFLVLAVLNSMFPFVRQKGT